MDNFIVFCVPMSIYECRIVCSKNWNGSWGFIYCIYSVGFFLQLKINWSRNHLLIILIGSIVPFGFCM